MKKVLMSVVMMGMAAGAAAAEFGDLPINAADLKVRLSAEGVAVPAAKMLLGTVKWYNEHKNMGYITIDDGREIQINESCMPKRGLKEGDHVEFTIKNARACIGVPSTTSKQNFVWAVTFYGYTGCYLEDSHNPGHPVNGAQPVDASKCERGRYVWAVSNFGYTGCYLEDSHNPGHPVNGSQPVSDSMCDQ